MYVNEQGQKVLTGGPEWKGVLEVIVDGEDLVARDVRMTWFAGGDDECDNSRGAFGDDLRDPSAVAVSLPSPRARGCKTPPLPSLPHNITVRVYSRETGKVAEAPLQDIGPSAPPRARAGIDGTQGLWRALGLDYRRGATQVDFRVVGGARYVQNG